MLLTLAFRGGLQSQINELKLVYLIRKLEDEDLVEGQSLGLAAWVAKELTQSIGKLVPQLPLPVVLELQNKVLKLLGGLVALLRQEIGNCVNVHLRGGGGGG